MKFDELLAQQLSMRFAYREAPQRARAHALPAKGALLRHFVGNAAVQAHARAGRAPCSEMLARPARSRIRCSGCCRATSAAARPSSRRIACLAAVDGGYQAAVMAPTEILAEQHWRKFGEWLAPLGVQHRRGCTAASRQAEEAQRSTAIASGEAQVVIGTHALFQEGVEFAQPRRSRSSTSSTASASASGSRCAARRSDV